MTKDDPETAVFQVVITTGLVPGQSEEALLSEGQVSVPRLRLKTARPTTAPLDGAWWPRSDDPAAELPGLIMALDRDIGTVERLMLGAGEWDSHPNRLFIDGRTVRLGWYASQPHGLLAVTTRGTRADLLVVPADCGADAAARAMAAAVDPANIRRASDILAESEIPPATADQGLDEAAWETEGGHLQRPQPRQ